MKEQFDNVLILSPPHEELKLVSLSDIKVNPYQPRKNFNEQELQELAQSIRTVGLLHPPLVRPLPDTSFYELISGERRFRASQLACLEAIPVYIRHVTSSISAHAALIENIQRVDLNPLEIAKALKRLTIEFGLTQEQLAQQIGKKRSTIANFLRLLTLPQVVQDGITQEKVTMGHAKAILGLNTDGKQIALYELIVRSELNVREAEREVQRMNKKDRRKDVPRDCYLDHLANKLREKWGTNVSIQGSGQQGRISLDYYSLDDLERLLELFGLSNIED